LHIVVWLHIGVLHVDAVSSVLVLVIGALIKVMPFEYILVCGHRSFGSCSPIQG
jgi:hypothetical protein